MGRFVKNFFITLLWILLFIVVAVVLFIVGLMIGVSVLGNENPLSVFDMSTWNHILNFIR